VLRPRPRPGWRLRTPAAAGQLERGVAGRGRTVEEITSNVAEHGYRGQGPLELASEIEEHRVVIRIEDEGPAFDPRQYEYAPPTADELMAADAGGHGIFLALRNLSAFDHERVGGRNRNTLIMRRD